MIFKLNEEQDGIQTIEQQSNEHYIDEVIEFENKSRIFIKEVLEGTNKEKWIGTSIQTYKNSLFGVETMYLSEEMIKEEPEQIKLILESEPLNKEKLLQKLKD